MHLVDWKRDAIPFHCRIRYPHQHACMAFHSWCTKHVLYLPDTKRLIPRKKYVRELAEKLSRRGRRESVPPWAQTVGPSEHPPGPLDVCNPIEKQKPPPLRAPRGRTSSLRHLAVQTKSQGPDWAAPSGAMPKYNWLGLQRTIPVTFGYPLVHRVCGGPRASPPEW